ncbi:MAG: DegT/DnrJ/EryC1/StrS family aminotransferase [Alphaproteobacteria bacterium]
MQGKPAITQKIPLVDLQAQYQAHKGELDAALAGCLGATSFIGGPDHSAFAREFADWCGGGHVALVGNGTDALVLALVELLGQGDGTGEVVTASHTFIATGEAITQAGYKPVFADIDPATYLMDLGAAEAAITPATRAILPVHIYGQMLAMDALMALAQRHGLKVIEDAAQAHGAGWQDARPGALSDAACFSFYPGKNLGAWGDAGAVFTRSADLAGRIAMRANHGRKDKYLHEFEGVSSRLDGLQAAILRVKLRHLDDWTKARRQVAGWYDELLADTPAIARPVVADDARHVYHLYVVQVEARDAVLKGLHDRGIGAGVHYPVPLHEQPAYAHLGLAPGDLPETARAARRILSLPIYPELSRAQAERVASALIEAVAEA